MQFIQKQLDESRGANEATVPQKPHSDRSNKKRTLESIRANLAMIDNNSSMTIRLIVRNMADLSFFYLVGSAWTCFFSDETK